MIVVIPRLKMSEKEKRQRAARRKSEKRIGKLPPYRKPVVERSLKEKYGC